MIVSFFFAFFRLFCSYGSSHTHALTCDDTFAIPWNKLTFMNRSVFSTSPIVIAFSPVSSYPSRASHVPTSMILIPINDPNNTYRSVWSNTQLIGESRPSFFAFS